MMLSDPLCACTMHSGYSSLYSVARQWILDKKISSHENGSGVRGWSNGFRGEQITKQHERPQ